MVRTWCFGLGSIPGWETKILKATRTCAQLLSRVWLCATPQTVACQAPLSMYFPRQEYWGGLPFPSLRYLPNSGIEPASPALADEFFTDEPPGKPWRLRGAAKKKKKEVEALRFPWTNSHQGPWMSLDGVKGGGGWHSRWIHVPDLWVQRGVSLGDPRAPWAQ